MSEKSSSGHSLPWYRVDNNLVGHPKVGELAEALGGSEADAGWLIIALWSWTMRYSPRGRLAPGARTALGRLAPNFIGRVDVVAALVKTGWLDEAGDGGWVVHDWDEHQGAAVAKAEKDSERKKISRVRRAPGSGAARAVPAPAAGTRRDETRRDETVEEDQPPPPKHVERGPLVYEEPTTPSHTWSPDDFFRWAQATRGKAGWVGEKWPARNLSHWWAEVLATPGMEPHRQGVDRLRAGFISFGKDEHWRKAKPPAPFQAFMSRWRDHVPPEIPGLEVES